MCEPTSITYGVVAVLALAGTAMAANAQYQQGKAASAEADFNAQVASNNAIIANQNAEAVRETGRADIEDKRRETQQQIGKQRAQLAAQGFDVSAGSSIDIIGDTAALGELDALRIDKDAKAKELDFRRQAGGFEGEAILGNFASRNAKSAGKTRAASTLLTGAAQTGATFLNN